jgi:hypothetical protein
MVISKGAVIFGHNFNFPLRWSLTKDMPPEEGEPDPPTLDEISRLMDRDSGIGSSIENSSGERMVSSSFYGLGSNLRLSHTSDLPSGQTSDMSEILSNEDATEGLKLPQTITRKRSTPPADSVDNTLVKVRRVERENSGYSPGSSG